MRTRILTIAIIFLILASLNILLFIPQATADDYVFGTNIKINDDDGTRTQKTPDLAVMDNGHIVAVWGDDRNGGYTDIYFSKSTDGGKLFGDGEPDTDIRVDNDPGDTYQRDPAIATSGNNVYVVWMDGRSGYYHIFFAKSTNGGASFTGFLRIDTQPTEVDLEFPDIAVSPSGTICVVWHEKETFDIYYTESTDGGASFLPTIRVDDTGAASSAQKYPKMAIDSEGDKYIVWQDNRSGSNDYDIYCAHASSSSTNFMSNVVRVDDAGATGSTSATRPCIATEGASNVYIAWKDDRTSASGDLYFDKSTDKGANFGTDIKVDDQSAGAPIQDRSSMAVDGGGIIHLAWEDKRTGKSEVYYANSTDSGANFGTNLRVTDSDIKINAPDHPNPVIAAGDAHQVYVSWKDKREESDLNIYFSKWGLSSQMGYPATLSNGRINKEMDGINKDFRYTVIYKDLDNDGPATGYPKLYVYTDHSKTTQLPGSPWEMQESDLSDKVYSNGKEYFKVVKLSEVHDYAYMFEAKASVGDQTIFQTPLKFGPKLDVTPPIFYDPAPDPIQGKWFNTQYVVCSITISDQDGMGVDPTKILYQYKTNSSSEWTRFYSNAVATPVGNTYRCEANITFKDGEENYVRWNATDLVSSGDLGYNISEAYEVKVDTTPVTFTNPVPPEVNWQNQESVTCSITINDFDGSGVDGTSVKYSYLPDGNPLFFGPIDAGVPQYGNTITVTAKDVPFKDGMNNFIKWHAKDLAGNEIISEQFNIKIDLDREPNVPPSPPNWIKPTDTRDSTPLIEWGPGSDDDPGDILEYSIQIGTFFDSDNILKWTSTGRNKYYLIQDQYSLDVGSYFVQLKAFDGLDYSSVFQSILNITATGNSPPSAPTSITPDLTRESRPMINWTGATDPDGDSLKYRIQIGSNSGADDILSFEDNVILMTPSYEPPTGLEDGIYYIQIISLDGFSGSSSIYQEFMKVAKFNPEITITNKKTVKQGDTSTSIKFTLKNNGSLSNNITLQLSGELYSKSSVTMSLKPSSPIHFDPYETKEITISIELPQSIQIDDYTFSIEVYSEDGLKEDQASRDVILEVTKSGPDTNGPTNGDDEKESDGFDIGSMIPIIAIIIIIIVVIAVIAAVASTSSKKKRAKQEEREFFHKEEEYEKLYGDRKKY